MWLFKKKGASGFSSSSTAEEVTEGIDGSGLTAILTGASSGIGLETLRVLALRGVHVIMGVRNLTAGSDVKEAIMKEIPTAKVDVLELDLSSMTNNAGVAWSPFMLSRDGIELHFATNHLGHFLLTDLVLENMKTAAHESNIEGRIINVASVGYRIAYNEGIRFDKINDKAGYKSLCAYGQSKLANILHANELSNRLKEQEVKITVNSLHPGAIITNILRHQKFLNGLVTTFGKYVMKNVEQGAATTCYLALHPQVEGVSGKYFEDCNMTELVGSKATDKVLAKKLWDFSVGLIN